MDSNSAPNNLHCTTVIVSYMKLAVGQELVTFYILHLDLQLHCITDLVYCSVTVKICHLLSFYSAPHRIARQPCRGGRGPLFTPQQEEAICAMVIANNAIRLREIQSAVIEDDNILGILNPFQSLQLTECSGEMKCAWNNCTMCHLNGTATEWRRSVTSMYR